MGVLDFDFIHGLATLVPMIVEKRILFSMLLVQGCNEPLSFLVRVGHVGSRLQV